MPCFTMTIVAAFSEKRGRRAFKIGGSTGSGSLDAWYAAQDTKSFFFKFVLD